MRNWERKSISRSDGKLSRAAFEVWCSKCIENRKYNENIFRIMCFPRKTDGKAFVWVFFLVGSSELWDIRSRRPAENNYMLNRRILILPCMFFFIFIIWAYFETKSMGVSGNKFLRNTIRICYEFIKKKVLWNRIPNLGHSIYNKRTLFVCCENVKLYNAIK